RLAIPSSLTWVIVVAAAAALAALFGVGIARCVAAIATLLADIALPSTQGSTDLADAPRRALAVTLEIGLLLLVGVPLVALTQPFMPRFPGAVIVVGVVVFLAVALWRSASNLQEHARAGAQAIAEV